MLAHRVPEPSITVNSGRGRHLYWILDSPVDVTDANREHLKSINRGLAKALGGDTNCVDLSRILRVPSFSNHKTNSPLPVVLDADNGHRYTADQFESFAVEANYPALGNVNLPDDVPELTEELDVRFRRVWGRDPEIRRAWRGEIGNGDSDSRFVLVKSIADRFTAEEVLTIVCSRRWFNRKSRHNRPVPDVERDARRLVAKFSH